MLNKKDKEKEKNGKVKAKKIKQEDSPKIIGIKVTILAVVAIIIFSAAICPVTLQNDTYYTIKIGEHIVNTKTVDMPSVAKEADIVIVAAGRAGVVGAEYVREGQTIIDVGINVNAEGKLCGDVDYAAVEPIVDAITPVPGGVGSVTTSVLVGHVVEAAMRKVNG